VGECRPRVGSLTYVSPSVALQRLLVEHLDVMVAHPSLRFRHGLSRGDAPRRDGQGATDQSQFAPTARRDRALRASETVPNCQSTDARIIPILYDQKNVFIFWKQSSRTSVVERALPGMGYIMERVWGSLAFTRARCLQNERALFDHLVKDTVRPPRRSEPILPSVPKVRPSSSAREWRAEFPSRPRPTSPDPSRPRS
jgi:hypothetical protein